MNSFHIVISIIFILFAVFQINDPDPIFWIALYGVTAVSAILFFFKITIPLVPLLVALVSIGGLLYLSPDFLRWIREGSPSITGSMKAGSPHIELVREFFGNALTAITGMGYWVAMRRRKKHKLKEEMHGF